MEVLFRYVVYDDFNEPHRRFRTKHEAEFYIQDKPHHTIKALPKPPKENIFEIYEEAPF